METEFKHVKCAEALANIVIKAHQMFHWEVTGTQTVVSKESHLEDRSGDIYSVTTEERFVTIDFKRSKTLPYSEERNEENYFGGIDVITKETINRKRENLKSELYDLKKDLNRDLYEVGTAAYSLFTKGELQIKDIGVEDVLNQIKSIDDEILNLTQQIEDRKAQQPTGGFFSRLKDKAGSVAKVTKIKLDIRGMRKKKEQTMPVLGERLYLCYEKEIGMPATLKDKCASIAVLKEMIQQKEDANLFLPVFKT
ncbi:hypothetical protein C5S31_04075 [ANME-1 cluster archaeon GoMg2]|nr:hypothetical protein [ANME-1 cluster archaeon GoMg2]